MSVVQIALDIKVEAQGLVEALAGREALLILPKLRHSPTDIVQHKPIALTCTAHALPAILLSRNSASCTVPNNLKQVRVGQSLQK